MCTKFFFPQIFSCTEICVAKCSRSVKKLVRLAMKFVRKAYQSAMKRTKKSKYFSRRRRDDRKKSWQDQGCRNDGREKIFLNRIHEFPIYTWTYQCPTFLILPQFHKIPEMNWVKKILLSHNTPFSYRSCFTDTKLASGRITDTPHWACTCTVWANNSVQ